MTVRKWLGLLPSQSATYKDCVIVDFVIISAKYILLRLQIPFPSGGIYEEIVSLDETVELVER